MSLENPPQDLATIARANLVATGLAGTREVEIWMGGAHTPRGTELTPREAARAVLIDCAGDVPSTLREAAQRFQSCVFLDVEERPPSLPRLLQLVDELVAECSSPGGPERIYTLCTHGMNRSGLVTGLLLRRLGFDHVEALDRIRAARPGALSNQTFASLIGGA